ncbi:uncharacterized protein BDR25DRAFT_259319 [Lindgomyces ingoldianus]|uniref:Uncharacterized protein n=1 Tax=Lindgomyces ingoldianus TaxID=673940 RepID=A0ACB6QYC7_9PLEO|nr:uncharacterized protein BDR25DRAFT_259319 [Lindgomyces ingoldianus]KAF2472003.1 hypothetical protein BDR25DRAFT_259319 [Lindgomyces ingoldianus]
MHKPKEREGAPSPAPVYMSSQQMASYLQDLRTNRVARPNGSRPPPPSQFNTWSSRTSSRFAETPAVSPFSHPTFEDAGVDVNTPPPASEPPLEPAPAPQSAPEPHMHRRTTSNMSIDAPKLRERTPGVIYRENGQRQVEREEARALRIAMEELDLEADQKLYKAALDEAAELVWKHRNPNAPGANPDAPYPYPGTDGKGAHGRSRSLGRAEQDIQRSNSKLRKRSSVGSNVSGSRSSSLQSRRAASGSSVTANADFGTSPPKHPATSNIGEDITALPQIPSIPMDAKHRRRASGSRRTVSGSLFKNPNDQIYEEPEEESPAPPAANPPPLAKLPLQVRRNPFSRVQFAKDNNLVRSNTDPIIGTKRFDRYEIQNNPPTQSRNAAYTSNAPVTPNAKEDGKLVADNESEVKMKDGKEIRSDELRAATGMRLKDRSPKLPTPTVVSDSPGRPIVSFKSNWKPKEVELKQEISALPQSTPKPIGQTEPAPRPLSKAATAPVTPAIIFPNERPKRNTCSSPTPIPQISVSPTPPTPAVRANRAQVPTINVYEDPPARPLPDANKLRKVNNPSHSAPPPVPTINVSQAPPSRSKPTPAPPIPTISVQETPSISGNPHNRGPRVNAPSISVTPSVPIIAVNEPTNSKRALNINPPSTSVTQSVPSINVSGSGGSIRPLPTPKHHASKSGPRQSTNSRPHWTPSSVRTGALCNQCALPISGRIVSAAGVRFHPECFLCHHCGEHLECVAFYPEPDNKRAERVARIQARMRGEDIEFLPNHPTVEDMFRLEQEDGDECMRFYCHLDFHELFSPRCKSCKTPIEGEVVVACGAEWHVGHFFCAQCGDPFDSSMPFVEKDGYAWCVDCHTNRYSTKCKKCRKPVTDTVIKALGAEWHMNCFCCVECSGPFEDGRYFLRGDSQDPVCVRCEERRLKA